MKKTFSRLKFFRIKKSILATLFALIANDFTFSQVTAEDSLFQQANYYLSIGYYDSAVNTLNKLVEMNPNSYLAYSSLGNIFQIQGKSIKAIEMYRKCIEIDSTLLPAYENLGNAYIDAGELSSAIAVHKLLIVKDSLYAGHYVNLGDAYMKNQDTTNAKTCFLKAIDLNKYGTLAHVNLATIYTTQKKYKEAIDELFLVRNLDDWYPLLQTRLDFVSTNAELEFEKWVEREPNNSEAHYYYAFTLWYTDEPGDAIDELEAAIEVNNKCEKYYLVKAIWLHNEEEYEEAIEECKKCLALNPDNWMCHNRYALTYAFLNRNDRSAALTHYKQAVEIDPMVIQSQMKLGETYIDNQQYSDAIESLNKALDNLIASGVKNPIIYFDLAMAYYLSRDYENAMMNAMTAKNMNFAEQSVKQDLEPELYRLINNIQREVTQKRYDELPSPDHTVDDYYRSGIEYAVKGEFEKANEKFEKALNIDPFYNSAISGLERVKDVLNKKIKSETAFHLFKGVSYCNKNLNSDAIKEFTKAAELNPEYPKIYVDRAISHFYLSNSSQAIEDLCKAIEINPSYSEAYLCRGFVYFKSGEFDEAIVDYCKSIELNSNVPLSYLDRALVYLEVGEYDNALNDFNKAIEINPKYADAYHDRGYLYYEKLGDKDKGCTDFKKACELGNCNNYNYVKRKGGCP